MERLLTLYLRYGSTSSAHVFFLSATLALALAGTLGFYRPLPDCNTSCKLI